MTATVTAELWSDWPCAGGTRLGMLTLARGTYSDAVDNSDALSATVLDDTRATPALRRVVMLTDPAGVLRGYRLAAAGRTRTDRLWAIRGASALTDLASYGLVRTISGGLTSYAVGGRYTATEFIDTLVLANLSADGLSHWARGTIDTTGYETITAPEAGWTRLEWCREVADRFGLELRARFNGSTSILIDLVTRTGGTATAVHVAFGKNLIRLQDDQDDGELATAITVLGAAVDGATAPADIGDNAWTLGTIPGGAPYWIPLTDPAGGAGPVAFASQFGTAAGSQAAYLLRSDGGTTQITDSRIAPDNAVLVAATTGLTAGHHVGIVADSGATRLTELRAPNVARLHRTDRLDEARGERNLLRNALLLNWADVFTPALWAAQGGTLNVGEYPRDTPATLSGIVTNGAQLAGAGGINFRGAPANARIYSGEYLVAGAAPYRVGNVVAVADGAGVGSIVFATGTLPAPIADGQSITFLGQAPKRPTSFPTERDANNLMRLLNNGSGTMPPSATSLRMQSEAFTVKYIAGPLAQVNAAVAFTMHNGSGASVGNLDAGAAITDDPDLVVTRRLPGVMLRNNSTAARLDYGICAQRIANDTTQDETATCSATLTADTTIDVCILPGASDTIFNGARWCTVWLGPSTGVLPYPGSWANLLWQRGNRALLARDLGTRQIACTLRDLSRAAGYSLTREQLVLGGDIVLDDLGITVRLLRITFDALNLDNPELQLDAMPTRLKQFLAERV